MTTTNLLSHVAATWLGLDSCDSPASLPLVRALLARFAVIHIALKDEAPAYMQSTKYGNLDELEALATPDLVLESEPDIHTTSILLLRSNRDATSSTLLLTRNYPVSRRGLDEILVSLSKRVWAGIDFSASITRVIGKERSTA